MRLDINTSRIDLSTDIRDYVERRAEFALGRFEHAIVDITVSLEDTNGPRGGIDQQCKIRVNSTGERSPILSTHTHQEIKAAIDLAFETVSRTVAKSLDRRIKRKQTPKLAGAI